MKNTILCLILCMTSAMAGPPKRAYPEGTKFWHIRYDNPGNWTYADFIVKQDSRDHIINGGFDYFAEDGTEHIILSSSLIVEEEIK